MSGADVAVLGGGVVGLTAAWLLAARGAEVTVLDAQAPGSGASHAAQGELVPPAAELDFCFRRSVEVYERLAEETGMPWDAEPLGTLLLNTSGDSAAGASRAVGAARPVSGSELNGLEPAVGAAVESGLLLDEGRRIEPSAVLAALQQLARDAGAVVCSGIGPARLVPAEGGTWAIAGPTGTRWPAEKVIVAAGLGSAALLAPHGIHVPLTGVRGRVLVTEPLAPVLRHVLAEYAIGAPRTVALLAHQNRSGHLVLGGSWYPQDEAEPADLTDRILARARRLLPGIGHPRIITERGGLRPVLPDRRPVADRLAPGLFGCFGHGGEGYILGPGTAALLADVVSGDIPAGASAFALRRWSERKPG